MNAWQQLHKNERWLMVALLGLIALALFGPVVIQPAHQHGFADQRTWHELPFAADVLSNLPFALWGMAGLLLVSKAIKLHSHVHSKFHSNTANKNKECGLLVLFFAGLLLTAGGSTWYHLQPNDAGLAVDRLGMVVAFAGLLGLAGADRVSQRMGVLLSGVVIVFGVASVVFWTASGNVLAWLVVQFGGMALMVWFACLKPRSGGLTVRWGMVIAFYALAKLLELADHQLYDLTAHFVSGHSLKHIVASFAAWPVISAIKQGRIFSLVNSEKNTEPMTAKFEKSGEAA